MKSADHFLEPVTIGRVRFGNPLMNGAYIGSKTAADIETLAGSASGGVLVGSISVKPRKRNPGEGYWRHKERFFSLNSFGLPNGGIPYYQDQLPAMVETAHHAGKPLVANVVGFAKEDYVTLVPFAEKLGADVVELNLGCPNVWEKGQQKRIVSYHADSVRETLRAVEQTGPQVPLWIKISPLPPDILGEVATVIADFGMVCAVTACNSYPNAAVTSGSQGKEDATEVLAGLAGRALKPISLGVVRQLRSILPRRIEIVAAGGIYTQLDVTDYLSAGAKAVQLASALTDEGVSVFDKICFQAKSEFA